MSKLLEGISVLESAQLFNGDRLGMLLGDLGADVIKVESPFRGDYLRDMPNLGLIKPHHSAAHVQLNKQKHSLSLDLRKDAAREVFWRLLATAHVFVDGNAGNACERLGIGYEEQRKRRPEIVYCQYSGFGSEGPYAELPTHGQMMDALAGRTPVEMGEDGLVRRKGTDSPTAGGGEGTATGAIYAAFYVAAGVVRSLRTGQGCFIDVASSDAIVSNSWIAMNNVLNMPRVPPELRDGGGMGGGPSARYQFYETKDERFILFCAIEHKFWENFCKVAGREDLIGDVDASSPVEFAGGNEPLRREIQKIFHARTQAEWVQVALEHDIAMGPAPASVEEMQEDPHLRTRGLFLEGAHPVAGPFTYLSEPGRVKDQPYEVRKPAPLLGEHTDQILAELGYAQDEIAGFREAKVI